MDLGEALERVREKADYRRDVMTHGMLLSAIWHREHPASREDIIPDSVWRLVLDGAVARLRRWEGDECEERKWHGEHQYSVLIEEDFVDRWCPGKGPDRTRTWGNHIDKLNRAALKDDDLWHDLAQVIPWPGVD